VGGHRPVADPEAGMRHLEGQLHLALIELLAARLE
jgi:hypothetical protein